MSGLVLLVGLVIELENEGEEMGQYRFYSLGLVYWIGRGF